MKEKIVVILGPTASGKSSLAIKLAKKFKGEVISADSRQVYRRMDVGTGKVSKRERKVIPHYLLDVADPKKQFTVSEFVLLAQKAVRQITEKSKIPFVVGGTAFYIYSLIDGLAIPQAKPSLKLRKALNRKTTEELGVILKNLDPKRYKTIDRSNRVRLIRAIEINVVTGKPVSYLVPFPRKRESRNILIIGIKKDQPELIELINKRVDARLKQGMGKEVKQLIRSGVSHKRLQELGLEYRYISLYLQGKLSYEQMVDNLKTAIRQFAKRQMTWFKRDSRIRWIRNEKEAEILVRRFTQ